MPDEPRTFDPTHARTHGLSLDDDGPPSGAQHGETHTRRPHETDADRTQGRKTRAANREKVKGSREHNP
jgi:hypothetical protein